MIKKIPCRVVRTASLSKSSDASRHASRSNNKHYKASDVVAVDVRVMYSTSSSVTDPRAHNLASGTVTYTGQSGTARVSIDNAPTGQILDCYA